MVNHSNRRSWKSLLQNPRTQLGLALLVVNYLIAYTVILFILVLGPNLALQWLHPEQVTSQTLTELNLFSNRIWPLSWAVIALCGVHSILRSHKVFGPITNVRNASRRIGEGDFAGRIKFRDGDMMDDLGNDLNAMLENLDGMMSATQEACDEVCDRMQAMQPTVTGTEAALSGERLSELNDSIEQLRLRLAAFDTTASSSASPQADDGAAHPRGEESDSFDNPELEQAA